MTPAEPAARAGTANGGASWQICLLVFACLAYVTGCQATVPAVRHDVPLLPAAWHSQTASRERWQSWGEQNLQSGDILFVSGQSRILLGLVDFSKLATRLSDSPFSHVALVAREGGEPVVYDIVPGGARRTAFADFVSDRRVHMLAVKRLRPAYRQHIPEAIEYCAHAWKRKMPFDDAFYLDNDRLYCSEMLEMAFRQAGLNLSDPVAIDQLPGYQDVPAATRQLIQAATPIRPNQLVFVPGNETIGLWASPVLEPVLDISDLRQPPGDQAETGPAGIGVPLADTLNGPPLNASAGS